MTLIVDNKDKPASSMTKREEAAVLVMAHLMGKDHGYGSWEYMASDSVDAVDALFKQLEKSQ